MTDLALLQRPKSENLKIHKAVFFFSRSLETREGMSTRRIKIKYSKPLLFSVPLFTFSSSSL